MNFSRIALSSFLLLAGSTLVGSEDVQRIKLLNIPLNHKKGSVWVFTQKNGMRSYYLLDMVDADHVAKHSDKLAYGRARQWDKAFGYVLVGSLLGFAGLGVLARMRPEHRSLFYAGSAAAVAINIGMAWRVSSMQERGRYSNYYFITPNDKEAVAQLMEINGDPRLQELNKSELVCWHPYYHRGATEISRRISSPAIEIVTGNSDSHDSDTHFAYKVSAPPVRR